MIPDTGVMGVDDVSVVAHANEGVSPLSVTFAPASGTPSLFASSAADLAAANFDDYEPLRSSSPED